jgi:hypothetical protein
VPQASTIASAAAIRTLLRRSRSRHGRRVIATRR